jgi:hypothetical protein
MRSVLFTIIGILAIGWALATLAPPHWVFGELFLLAASVLVVRDYLLTRDQGRRIAGTGNSAWFADAPLEAPDTQSDLERAQPDTHVVYSHKQSVEQIAHDMLMQAFRQASRKHHPDHGGEPEDMRRVYAARDMILRAIHKP